MILVDQPIWPYRGKYWAHLISNVSYEELHSFAARLGLGRSVFQGDHYDVHAALRERAIELGAVPVDFRELARMLNRSGLRKRK